MNINPNDYIAAGYMLVKVVDRKEWQDADLVPERIISLSSCIGIQLDVMWAWNLDQYAEQINAFGIPETRFDEFVSWNNKITEQVDPGYPRIFSLIRFLQELVRNFITDYSGLHMIGIAVHQERVEAKWPHPHVHDETFNRLIAQGKPLEVGGNPLGFEVVGVDYGLECSWYCSGLEKDMRELFEIRPGKFGLLQSYEEARQVVDWIEAGDLGTRSEPYPYEAWLLVEYPLEP